MVTKARKKFVVVAYDISSARRRNKVVKILQQYGRRINFSVFECMFSDGQLSAVREEIGSIINLSKDQVVYYQLCLGCYARAVYQPERRVQTGGSIEVI